ncbi:MAG: NADH-quinone oxidoreductase subunit J [Isosphaeraceae bacterium]
MNRDLVVAILVVIFGATGTFLLLPHKHGSRKPRNVHAAGAILAGISLLAFLFLWSPPGPFFNALFFYGCGITAVAAAVAMVASRDPIHSALWFAAVVLASTGLLVLAGAQFLAAGTVIVYAGAIIVTFLFVIMLAQMEGRAPYDRAARIPFRATWTCFTIFLGIMWLLLSPASRDAADQPAAQTALAPLAGRIPKAGMVSARPLDRVLASASRATAQLNFGDGQPKPHVAGLGETLYTDHLVTVELAGALLFAALIGALCIASPKPPIRPGTRTPMESV